jgi:hypothetical protein
MATKFKRPDFRDSAHGTHQAAEEPVARRRLSLRTRLKLVYLGLGVALAALLVFEVVNPFRRFSDAPLQEGTATVAEKARADGGDGSARYRVVLHLTDKDGRKHETTVATDAASYGLVEEGAEVLVEFKVNRSGEAVRVTRILAPVESGSAGP